MPTLKEIAIKRAEKAKQEALDAKQAAKDAREAAKKARSAAEASRKQAAWLIGSTILEFMDKEELTPEELAMISRIFARKKNKPSNWDAVEDWIPSPEPQPVATEAAPTPAAAA